MEFCWQPIESLPNISREEDGMGWVRVLFYDPALQVFHIMRPPFRSGEPWVRSLDHRLIDRYAQCVWTPLEYPDV